MFPMLLAQWLNAIRSEFRALITGSLLLATLGLYQVFTDRPVSPWLYSAIVLFFLCWALFKTWAKEKARADAAIRSIYEGQPIFALEVRRVTMDGGYNFHLENCGERPARHVHLSSVSSYRENYDLHFGEITVLRPHSEGTDTVSYRVTDKNSKAARLSAFLKDNPEGAAVVWWDIHIEYWDTDNAIKVGGIVRLCYDVETGALFVRAAPYTALGFKPHSP
jgi:hypothetical protein